MNDPKKSKNPAQETRIGEHLLDRQLITAIDLKKGIAIQARRGGRIGDILVGLGVLGADDLRSTLSDILGVPAVDLETTYGDPLVLDMIPKEKAFELKVVPLFMVENQLTVALPDPSNIAKLDEIRFLTGKEILPVLALERDVDRHLTEYFGELDPWTSGAVIEFESPTGTSIESAVSLDGAEVDRPLVRLVNLMIARAIQEGASDIHLEPQEGAMAVRYRIDGLLQTKSFNIPATVAPAVISRVKILSEIDISEKRIPQDGKLRVRYRDRRVDVRTSTFPTIHGEKAVLRLLDKERQDFHFDNIGMSDRVLTVWRSILRRREGILLVTGPTGSGKSSTLYATLRHLNQPDINIVTLEDPVEYELSGVSQGQVRDQAGFTFAKGIRSILRQDPDVILVGEIRDLETAQIAVQAALTGHLVLSTLHTNDAPSAVIRLVDMGVPRFLVAASVIGILAQRLVRNVCPNCVADAEPPPDEIPFTEPWTRRGIPYRDGAGCEKCLGIGYRGRTGAYELMVMNQNLQAAVSSQVDHDRLLAMAREAGYRRMWWDGLEKVQAGVTTLKELMRSVQTEEDPGVVADEGGPDGKLQEPS